MISHSISSSSTPLHSQVRAALGRHQGYVLCCEQWPMRKTSGRHGAERKCHRSTRDKRHICISAPWPQGSHKHHRRWGKKTARARSQGGPEQKNQWLLLPSWTHLPAQGQAKQHPKVEWAGTQEPPLPAKKLLTGDGFWKREVCILKGRGPR